MDERLHEVREVRLDDLIPFQLCPAQTYQGERLEQLAHSIERVGLMNPIIVRLADGGKCEIICGHNRANAMRKLGHDTILADVWEGLSDDDAIELFYDSNLNQQSFSDWNYSQKIEAIRYIEKMIRENSQQGRRNDLEDQTDETIGEGTSVQDRHKSDRNSRRSTTRDRMSRRLGIATATLSKYRSIIKLPDDLVDALARLLDAKRITFEAAYRMSGLNAPDVKKLVEYIEESPNKKIDLTKLKELCTRSKGTEKGSLPRFLSKDDLKGVLVARSGKLPVTRRN